MRERGRGRQRLEAYSSKTMFDVAAERYGKFVGRFSRLLSPQMADLAELRSGQRAVDVGCGPGALSRSAIDVIRD